MYQDTSIIVRTVFEARIFVLRLDQMTLQIEAWQKWLNLIFSLTKHRSFINMFHLLEHNFSYLCHKKILRLYAFSFIWHLAHRKIIIPYNLKKHSTDQLPTLFDGSTTILTFNDTFACDHNPWSRVKFLVECGFCLNMGTYLISYLTYKLQTYCQGSTQ